MAEWLRSKAVRAYNIAFIKLQQPLSRVVPVKFEGTPKSGPTSLGVVAYAGDLVDKYTGEKGAHMYGVFSDTNWNLEDTEYISWQPLSELHRCILSGAYRI